MTTTRRSTIRFAALICFTIALAACGSTDESESAAVAQVEEEPTTAESTPDEPTPGESAPATVEPAEAAPTTAASTIEPTSFVSDARPLTEQGFFLDEGTYRVDTIGTPFSFVVDRPLSVQRNNVGEFILTHPGSLGPDDRDIVFLRLSDLSDPAEPNQWFEDIDGGWPADDLTGWVDNLADGVTTSEPEETTLGGLPATRIDVEIGEIPCVAGPQFCVGFGTDHLFTDKFLNPGSSYRIWVVDQGDEAPIGVFAATTDADGDWFETADEILSTLTFGDAAPGPVFAPPAGPADVAVLGGVNLEFEPGALVAQSGSNYAIVRLEDGPAAIVLLSTPATPDGTEIESTDDLVAAFRTAGTEITEIEPTTVGGIESRVFEMRGEASEVLKRGVDDARTYAAPPLGRLWVVEHPDRGLLMITAEAFSDDADYLDVVVAPTSALVSTLTFTESS